LLNLKLGRGLAFLQKKLPNQPEMLILHAVISVQAQLRD
jgi:hypothetical protein